MNETELLFTEILKCDRLSLYLNKDLSLDKEKIALVSVALKRRILGEPIQYILGKAEFMGMEFKVTPEVLIPRPETELLVEKAIEIGHRLWVMGGRLRILDIGTGCGNIAISVAKMLPGCEMHAVDISEAALKIARENALNSGVNINFIEGNLFPSQHLTPSTYHLIVSNPPYIPSAEIAYLQPEVRSEPVIALDGGVDGLDYFRRIVDKAAEYLDEKGYLILEIGFGQLDAINKIFQDSGTFSISEIIRDYSSIERIVVAQKAINLK